MKIKPFCLLFPMLVVCLSFSACKEKVRTAEEFPEKDNSTENITVPPGYIMVWHEEFASSRLPGGKPALPDTDRWWYETGDHGWGNNELQKYIPAVQGADTCAVVSDGTLKIILRKTQDQILSVRMNSRQSWTYGYFEARMKLPRGKGTWPAFWLMPEKGDIWPDDGEIDIMEEVGYRPNWVVSTIHCKAYYHSIGTQKNRREVYSYRTG